MKRLAHFVGDDEFVIDQARGPADVRRIRREVEGRQWASRHGIPTAEIVAKDADDHWLVSRRVVDAPGEPTEYVAAALDVAERIQRLPPPRFANGSASWRAPRRTMPVRLRRMVRAGIDPRAFLRTRRAYEALPLDSTVHNDYHRHNVLNTSALGHVTVIDWEHTSLGPRHHDALRMILTIPDPVAAHAAWRMLLASVPPGHYPGLAVQLRWLALRTYAGDVIVSPHELDRAKGDHRRERWEQARRWAEDLETEPKEVR